MVLYCKSNKLTDKTCNVHAIYSSMLENLLFSTHSVISENNYSYVIDENMTCVKEMLAVNTKLNG